MLNKSEEAEFIKKVLGDDVGHKSCFTWEEFDCYYYVGICTSMQAAVKLADEYYLRGISFIQDVNAEVSCTGSCRFACSGLGFLLSKEVTNDPLRYLYNEYHTKEEHIKFEELVKPYSDKMLF